jgi:hypothetical protein
MPWQIIGHYPDKRSGAKGIEPEGLEAATFGGQRYFFVLAERARWSVSTRIPASRA